MRILVTGILILILVGIAGLGMKELGKKSQGAPPYGEAEEDAPESEKFSWVRDWKRPEGPAKVGLQVGHWKNNELPEELERLKGSTGSAGGGKSEWEVNLKIVEIAADLLRERGVSVEIIPATVPQSFWADVFVAVHADGSLDSTKSGFKIASGWRDYTGKAGKLVGYIVDEYQSATAMAKDPNITRNMRGYYAFAWWRFAHAIHPMTTAAIVETGFLTSASDRRTIVLNPKIPADALARGIGRFLESEGLLE